MFMWFMHDLPHCITTSMHQCMFISICMFMAFKQSKTLISIKKNKKKSKQNKEADTQRYEKWGQTEA